MAFSPGDTAENAQVAIRAARVSAKFCPFIFRSWQKWGAKWVQVGPELSVARWVEGRRDFGFPLLTPFFLSPG
jgi:hypothetical protein